MFMQINQQCNGNFIPQNHFHRHGEVLDKFDIGSNYLYIKPNFNELFIGPIILNQFMSPTTDVYSH